jgi:hypothetical protein
MKRLFACALAFVPWTAVAGDPALLEFGRYLAKYPAMYSTLALSHDSRDEIFDAQGHRRDGVAPTYGPGSRLPQRRADLQLEWFFPFFETEAIPLVSSRLWTARADLGYEQNGAVGPIADYASANAAKDEQSGITDVTLHFGPVLHGSHNWRGEPATALSIVLLGDASIPIGRRHPDAATNAGSNVFSYGATLGAYWRPVRGVFLDAGAHWRAFGGNEEPAFNAQEPTQNGAQLSFDATLAIKIWGDFYASGSFFDLRGEPNEYRNVRSSPNPPSADLLMESFPDPGSVRDAGIRDRRAGAALHWFALPRLRLSLHHVIPLSGRSGEFDLAYQQQPASCGLLPLLGCSPAANGSDHVDGLGAARVFASRHWMLSATWNWGQGDLWLHGP